MKFGVITLFPEMFEALKCGMTGQALKRQLISLEMWNPRAFTQDSYKTVDDRPYGGGPGMVMKPEPLDKAIQAAKKTLPIDTKVIYVSPQGKRLTQKDALSLSKRSSMLFIAGRYEGIDERLIETQVDEEWSIGDYVLSGGELAVMVMIDALTRLLPGVLGSSLSAEQDSFSNDLLDCPHYTRPETFKGLNVPAVLLSGDHEAIRQWRLERSIEMTLKKRPDLLKQNSSKS